MIYADNIQSLSKKNVINVQVYILCFVFLFAIANAFISGASAQTNQVQDSQIQGDQDNTQVYSGVVFGPVGQNDTLWRIASRYKQDSPFSVFQTMLAIFELNQQAFENGNFNTMVNGATLRLPSDLYIARIDPQRARAKATSDDRALGPRSSANSRQAPSTDVKSEILPLNQENLFITSLQLQSQLDGLRQQQQRQFDQLKRQVSTSISAVELLLEENKKLSNQLLQLDENNQALTQKVESELQNQINQQLEQLSLLATQVTDAENRRIDQESESILSVLSSPLALIIILSVVTLLLIAGFGLFLLRKPSQAGQKGDAKPAQGIVNEDLVIGEIDDELDKDSKDLMATSSKEDTFPEDDILSDAMEDDDVLNALPDVDMEDVLNDLDDLLVPDSPSQIFDTESKNDKGSSQAVQLDSQNFFDENIEKLGLSESQTISRDNTAKDAEDPSDEPYALLGSIGEDTFVSRRQIDDTVSQDSNESSDESLDVSNADSDMFDTAQENVQVSKLAEELLNDLENDNDDGPLSGVIDDIDKTTDSNSSLKENHISDEKASVLAQAKSNPTLDANELLDDIPRFTSDMSFNDGKVEDFIEEVVEPVIVSKNSEQSIQTEQEDTSALSEIRDTDDIGYSGINKSENENDKSDANNQKSMGANQNDEDDRDDGTDEGLSAGFKDLHNWLDEGDNETCKTIGERKNIEVDLAAMALDDEFYSLDERSLTDDELVQGLDDANFDKMLDDLANESAQGSDNKNTSRLRNDPLSTAVLDIDALANDESIYPRSKGAASELATKEKSVDLDLSSKNFVDVDDLIEESDAAALMSDSDKRLDLNSSLGRLNTKQNDEFNIPDIGIESDQASNLDLAQVYMDMEDFEAAQELLDEVIRLGTMDQQEEAKALLVNLNK